MELLAAQSEPWGEPAPSPALALFSGQLHLLSPHCCDTPGLELAVRQDCRQKEPIRAVVITPAEAQETCFIADDLKAVGGPRPQLVEQVVDVPNAELHTDDLDVVGLEVRDHGIRIAACDSQLALTEFKYQKLVLVLSGFLLGGAILLFTGFLPIVIPGLEQLIKDAIDLDIIHDAFERGLKIGNIQRLGGDIAELDEVDDTCG